MPESSPADSLESGRTVVSLVVPATAAPIEPQEAVSVAEIETLRSQITDLEMRLRERDEQQMLTNAELHALERDLVIKEAYVSRLEFEQQLVRTEIGQVRDRAAELFGDLERAEARIAELGAMVADMRAQRSYRLAVQINQLLHGTPTSASLKGALRALLRGGSAR